MKTLRVYDNPRCAERYTVLLPNYRLDTGEIFLEILSVTENGDTFFAGIGGEDQRRAWERKSSIPIYREK